MTKISEIPLIINCALCKRDSNFVPDLGGHFNTKQPKEWHHIYKDTAVWIVFWRAVDSVISSVNVFIVIYIQAVKLPAIFWCYKRFREPLLEFSGRNDRQDYKQP